MSDATRVHRLDGFEPDNLLSFLALLGLLRALEADDRDRPEKEKLRARVSWSLDDPPLRPILHVSCVTDPLDIVGSTISGLARILPAHGFGGRKLIDFSQKECQKLLKESISDASPMFRDRTDALAALMTDQALRLKKDSVEPTPLCLQFGGGQQYFLERLAQVPRQDLPTKRPGRTLSADSPEECLRQTLFDRWSRDDDLTTSFRWDAEEDSRWAMMAGDPTDTKYKIGTQHGANRLASVGLSAVTVVPVQRRTRVRVGVLGGAVDRGRFTFSWPIWREQASLSAIRAMLGHPELLVPRGLSHLGVEQVFTSRRIDDRSMNFTRALPLSAIKSERIEPQHRKRAR